MARSPKPDPAPAAVPAPGASTPKRDGDARDFSVAAALDSSRAGQFLARRGVGVVLAFAALIHFAHWIDMRSADPFYAFSAKGFDMATYWDWAQKIAKGDWLSREFTRGQPFYYGPLYPYVLALLFLVTGPSHDAVHLLQAALGVIAPLCMFLAGRRLFGAVAGFIAAVLTTLCAPLLLYSQLLLMEGMVVTLHAVVLWTFVAGGRPGARHWAWALGGGLCAGLSCLGRGNFLLVVPFLALAWLWVRWHAGAEGAGEPRPRFHARLALPAAAFLLGFAAIISVSLARNVVVSGRWVPTTGNGPVLLYLGNARDSVGIFGYPESYEALTKAAGGQSNVRWSAELRREITADFGAWLRLLGSKFVMFWNEYDCADNVSYPLYSRFVFFVKWNPIEWSVVVALGFFGLVTARRRWRDQVPLYVFVVFFSASIIAVFVVGRYRLSTLLPLLLWSGAGIAAAIEGIRGRRPATALACVATLVLGCLLLRPTLSPGVALNTPPGVDAAFVRPRLVRMNDYTSFAEALRNSRRDAEARELVIEAVAENPWYRPAALDLAETFRSEGKPEAAINVLENYTRWMGADPRVFALSAVCYMTMGDAASARALIEQANKMAPQDKVVREISDALGYVPAGGGSP